MSALDMTLSRFRQAIPRQGMIRPRGLYPGVYRNLLPLPGHGGGGGRATHGEEWPYALPWMGSLRVRNLPVGPEAANDETLVERAGKRAHPCRGILAVPFIAIQSAFIVAQLDRPP